MLDSPLRSLESLIGECKGTTAPRTSAFPLSLRSLRSLFCYGTSTHEEATEATGYADSPRPLPLRDREPLRSLRCC